MRIKHSKPFIYKTSLDLDLHELRKEFEHVMLLHDVVQSYRQNPQTITEIHVYPKGNTHNS